MRITGLTREEVLSKKARGLVNDYEPKSNRSIARIIFTNFFTIFNLLLLPLLVILFSLKQYKDVMSVGVIALANTLINLFQEIKSKIALDKIKMSNPPTALVLRDDRVDSIPVKEIVQGDYLLLKSGELVLADGHLVESQNLEMDESMLTGESDYIQKNNKDNVMSGSFAVTGSGVYIAEKIGAESYMQKVVEQSRKASSLVTPLEHKVRMLVNTFMGACLFIAILLIMNYWPFSGKIVEPVRFIVASVTSMIPQGLVLIVTITFALGVIAFAKEGVIFQKFNAVEALSDVNLICMDKTGTLTHNRIVVKKIIPLGKTKPDTLKKDLADLASCVNERNKTIDAIAARFKSKDAKLVEEIPFKSKNKYSAARVKRGRISTDYIMGAYEMLLPLLKYHNTDPVAEQIAEFESKGMRTIVIGKRKAVSKKLKSSIQGFTISGIITFFEEIKKEAPSILKKFSKKGIRQVVISGDSLTTVKSIAMQIGLEKADSGVTGIELETLDPEKFKEKVLETTIFARVAPEQKRDIIKIFKDAGYYTAMVGDGVNDVLALKESNLAIAMGSGGSMAKDVSDIILVNNKFSILPSILSEGDKIISRIQDCARIFTLKNFYALTMVIAILVLGITFPFLPQQISLINFITITIPLLYLIKFSNYKTKVEKSFLPDIIRFSVTFGSLIAVTALGLNYLYTAIFGTKMRVVQTVAMAPIVTLGISSYLYLLNRAKGFKGILKDKRMLIVSAGLMALFVAAVYFPPIRKFVEIVPLKLRDWGFILGFTGLALIVQRFLMKWYMGKTEAG